MNSATGVKPSPCAVSVKATERATTDKVMAATVANERPRRKGPMIQRTTVSVATRVTHPTKPTRNQETTLPPMRTVSMKSGPAKAKGR